MGIYEIRPWEPPAWMVTEALQAFHGSEDTEFDKASIEMMTAALVAVSKDQPRQKFERDAPTNIDEAYSEAVNKYTNAVWNAAVAWARYSPRYGSYERYIRRYAENKGGAREDLDQAFLRGEGVDSLDRIEAKIRGLMPKETSSRVDPAQMLEERGKTSVLEHLLDEIASLRLSLDGTKRAE